MPTILRIGSFRFHFYSNEGSEPAHILEPVLLASNRGVSPHDLREIERHVFENKKLLLDNYNEYHYL